MTRQLLTVQELAEELRVSVHTIYALNTRGRGPKRIKVGRTVRYRRVDVDRWLEKHSIDEAA